MPDADLLPIQVKPQRPSPSTESKRPDDGILRENGGAYLRRRIFAPRDELAEAYPEAARRPYLTPYYQAKRWGSALRRRNVKRTLRAMREVSPEQTEALCTGVICDLNEPLGELMDPDDDDDDDEEDDDDFEFGDDDDDDDMEIDLEDLIREDPKIVTRRRSRITQFPGKKF